MGSAAVDVRVSVLITTYNHEAFIGQALDSVLGQQGVGPFEVLVGDDCSTDGTRAVIDGFARSHPGVVLPYYPSENLGGAGKVLYGELVERSRGQYLAGLDGDDYWTSPDKLRAQAAHLDEHPECVMCFHNVVRRTDGGAVPDTLYNPPDQAHRLGWPDLFEVNPVGSCSPMIRREVLDPLPSWYFELPWGDLSLYLLAAGAGEIHYLPEVMGVYRLHGAGMFSGMTALQQETLDVDFFRGLAGVVPPAAERFRKRRLAVALGRLAHQLALAGERKAAQRRLAESFRVWPLDPRQLRPGRGELRRLALWLSLHATASRRRHEAARSGWGAGPADPMQPPSGA